MMYPPSSVCRTEYPSSSTTPPKVLSHSIIPEASVLTRYTSHPPAPEEYVLPAMMYPPSVVCCTDSPASHSVPPNVFSHWKPPEASVLTRYTSHPPPPPPEHPAGLHSPVPKDPVIPVMMYPPSVVCCTEYATSKPAVLTKIFSQSAWALELRASRENTPATNREFLAWN